MDFTKRLLQPYLDPSIAIRSVVALGVATDATPAIGGDDAVLLTHSAAGIGAWDSSRLDFEPPASLGALADSVRARCGATRGADVLLTSAERLRTAMPPLADAFPFAGVVVLVATPARDDDDTVWKLRRDLFDRGLVCVASSTLSGCVAHGFLASDVVATLGDSNVAARGRVTVATLGRNGRFANQLFQYAYAKLYALRHGLAASFPDWEGRRLYGLDDPRCAGEPLHRLSFAGFADEDRELWERDAPPIDVDLLGYFQETPACWRRHRPLLRKLFQLPADRREAVDAWRRRVTGDGRRTLVAVHVRRGDYLRLQHGLPYFRIVPVAWYLEWLRALWPTLRDPVLFVATDEPDAIAPAFAGFETVAATFGPPADALPDHVRDFEVLRRADHLAICNSSYSRMAAILAPDGQRCWLPSVQAKRFLPYEPWIDPAFWKRFAAPDEEPDASEARRLASAAAPMVVRDAEAQERAASILLDVSDLVRYLADNAAPTGIQRVIGELVRHLVAIPHRPPIRLVVLDPRDVLMAVDSPALVAVLDDIAAGSAATADLQSRLRAILGAAVPCAVRPRDVFLAVGAFWVIRRMGSLMQALKDAQAIVAALIHDLLPVDAPEFFEATTTTMFVKAVVETLTFADFAFTASEYNKASLARFMDSRGFDRIPIHLLPLARERASALPGAPVDSALVKEILAADYVLCVGTIEVRKNPHYLFQVWKLMVASGRPDIPTLVFAGRKGWLVRDFMDQLEACNYLDGRIVLVHDANDVELDALYRNCLLTMFPSFAEGWGLPVGESLAHGKICLCSATGGIPDVGGTAADYLDPYDARDGFERLVRYLDDPDLRRRREREIVDRFEPRSWRDVAGAMLTSTLALARQVQPGPATSAIRLPAGRFLPISSVAGATPLDATDGSLSAELACVSGWHAPGVLGARAAGPEATLRFRTATSVGSHVVVVLRVAADAGPLHLRIRPGAGAVVDVSIASDGEGVGVVPCDVGAGQVVTLQLSAIAEEGAPGDPPPWTLRGIMYFDPKRVAGEAERTSVREPMIRATPASLSPLEASHPGPANAAGGHGRLWLAKSVSMDDTRRASSFGDFLQSTDTWWPSEATIRLDPPIVADEADARAFAAGCASSPHAGPVGRDAIRLVRRSDVYVSMARFTEGSIFDGSGVWRAMGYLQGAPRGSASWLSSGPNGVGIDSEAMAAAPYHDVSCPVFYNGNLHNYYHWLVEGLLGLDLMTRAMGPDARRRILLPKSMEIAAVFDHRRALDDVGLAGRVEEVAADLIRVREAVWVDSDLVQTLPAPYLRDFQQRVASRYDAHRGPRGRRLLIARKGPARTIANLPQVQDALSRLGFETVYLEGMSMADQIRMFLGAEFVIGPHGAGLANLVFCEPGTKVIEFMPSIEFRPFFWLISEKLDLVHGIQFCPTSAGDGFQGSLGVDVGKLQALVRMVDAASAATAPAIPKAALGVE